MGKESGDKGDWGKGDNSAGSFKQSVGFRNRVGIELSLPPGVPARARIFKLLRSPIIDSKEPIPSGSVAWYVHKRSIRKLIF